MPSRFLTASWKNLIAANYIVDSAVLLSYLPHQTVLEDFNGNIYVSLVGFMFADTKLLGMRIPFHVNFEEVNLRFYVRYNDTGEWKRGTVFISEIVPKRSISFIANTVYHENYCTKRMRHFHKQVGEEIQLGYHWKHQQIWNKLEATIEPIALAMQPGSEEEFIAEHYWGYSRYDPITTYEYNVQHPAWKVFPVKDYLVDCDFGGLYGRAFAFLGKAKPNSVFVAEGSEIAVLRKRRL